MLNNKGLTITQLLISLGVSSALVSGFSMYLYSLFHQSQAMQQHLDRIETQSLLSSIFLDGGVCTSILAKSDPPKEFNPNDPNFEIALTKIPLTHLPDAPDFISVGQSSYNQTIAGIKVNKFASTGGSNMYSADLVVEYQNATNNHSPLKLQLLLYTQSLASGNKQITGCSGVATNFTDRVHFHFGTQTSTDSIKYCNPTCTWTVPENVKGTAFISIAGGGASAIGVLQTKAAMGGNSGGFLINQPINLVPGESIQITVGKGGRFVEDPTKIAGKPGLESRFGNYLRCSGGGVPAVRYVLNNEPGWEEYQTSLVYLPHYNTPGFVRGVIAGVPPGFLNSFFIPAQNGGGVYGSDGPGACGPNGFGIGTEGMMMAGGYSGIFAGGATPLYFGSGGGDSISGAAYNLTTAQPVYPNLGVWPANTVIYKAKKPGIGVDGIVIVDYLR